MSELQTQTPIAPSSDDVLIEVTGLSKSYWLENRRIDVLQDAHLRVTRSQTVAIVGASGAGKSTLLHLLGTLDLPTTGSIRILGRDITEMNEDDLATFRNQTMGFVFQAHYLLPEFSAVENVMMPALIQRMHRKEARKQAMDLLAWVGLGHRWQHRPGELSGGERQRVAMCRALIMHPPLLLADEPTGNLDARTSEGIHQLLLEMHRTWGVTPIVVTHNLTLAQRMDKLFHLTQGKIDHIDNVAEFVSKLTKPS